MSDDLDSRIRAALPGIPEPAVLHQRQNWTPENFIRRILLSENQRKIEEAHKALESCEPDELKDFQGRIKGLRDANANINAIGVETSQRT